jgi:uncharacterized protein with HEPN domain
MDNPKNDTYYINKIHEDLSFIMKHMRDVSQDDLGQNEVLLDSMMFRLIQISENAKKLSDTYKVVHKDIPWTAIYGLRNRIVHDYGNVDLSIVYSTLKDDIPQIIELISEDESRC